MACLPSSVNNDSATTMNRTDFRNLNDT